MRALDMTVVALALTLAQVIAARSYLAAEAWIARRSRSRQ